MADSNRLRRVLKEEASITALCVMPVHSVAQTTGLIADSAM